MNDTLKKLLKNQLFITGLILLFPSVLCAVAAPWIAPHDPNQQLLNLRLKPPLWQGGEPGYLLGTDALGRDLLSRVIYGARVSLTIGIAVVIVSSVVGTFIGVVAGYFGGIIDSITMRIIDTFLAFPFLLLALGSYGRTQTGFVEFDYGVSIYQLGTIRPRCPRANQGFERC